jgi:Na+-driven multidrug efflux pump
MNLTQGDIKSQLIKIAFPAGIGMMFHTFYNITDTFYAGLIGSEAIGAMAITFPVFFILLALAIGFSQGTTALISNYIGAKDIKNACEVYIQALIYSLFISIVIGLLIFYSSEWIFNFFGAEDDFLLMAINYISVIALGAPFMILNLVVNSALNSIGDTKKNRNIMVFGFFLNIGLESTAMLWFIYLFQV